MDVMEDQEASLFYASRLPLMMTTDSRCFLRHLKVVVFNINRRG